MTNIIVVFRKIEDAKAIKGLLMRNGFPVTAVCTTGSQAIAQADGLTDGVVICGYQMQDMLYSGIRESIPPDFEMLLMASKAILPNCRDNGVVCLSMPLKAVDLVNTLMMIDRKLSLQRKRRRQMPKKRSEEDEKILREAKETLMERNNMTEDEAHKYLQKCSMDSGTSIVETAQMVMTVYR